MGILHEKQAMPCDQYLYIFNMYKLSKYGKRNGQVLGNPLRKFTFFKIKIDLGLFCINVFLPYG